MSAVAPGWKLRVLLAQALFSDPDILLLDEPTNNLDIHTISWLADMLNQRNSTMIIISHDRHFLNSVCTHVADMDYGTLKVYPGNYDDYMEASTQARNQQLANNAKAKEKVAELQDFVRRFSANKSKARQATSRAKQIDKIKIEEFKPSSRAYPFVRFEGEKKLHRLAVETEGLSKSYDRQLFKNFSIMVEAGERIAIIGANGAGKTTLLRCIGGAPDHRPGRRHRPREVGGEREPGLYAAGSDRRVRHRPEPDRLDGQVDEGRRRRPGRALDPGPPAVRRRRGQEVGARAVRRREGPHDVRQADAGPSQRAAARRADQPHGHGIDRIAEHRAGQVCRHADLRLARPRIRVVAGDPHPRVKEDRIIDFRAITRIT
jgi:ABC-type multidrug transport system ATPase subunit